MATIGTTIWNSQQYMGDGIELESEKETNEKESSEKEVDNWEDGSSYLSTLSLGLSYSAYTNLQNAPWATASFIGNKLYLRYKRLKIAVRG